MPPADRQVLLTAFRTLLTEARDGTPADRHQMLRDALAFGDDVQRRAATTAMIEAGERKDLADLVQAVDPEAAVQVTEWFDLTSLRSGRGPITEALFKMQGEALPSRPKEFGEVDHLAQLAGVSVTVVQNSADVRALAQQWAVA